MWLIIPMIENITHTHAHICIYANNNLLLSSQA